jgi:hypothetical protein
MSRLPLAAPIATPDATSAFRKPSFHVEAAIVSLDLCFRNDAESTAPTKG